MPSNTGKAIKKPTFERKWGQFPEQYITIIHGDICVHASGNTIAISKREIDDLITGLRAAKRNV
jgi:hypothetical protein